MRGSTLNTVIVGLTLLAAGILLSSRPNVPTRAIGAAGMPSLDGHPIAPDLPPTQSDAF